MGLAIGGEPEKPLIDSRAAALLYAEECGLAASPNCWLLLLLSSKSRLLSTALLPSTALDPVDSDRILRAARDARASAFVLLTCSQAPLPPDLPQQLSRVASICREFGVDFVDLLQISGSVARSLVWDGDSARPAPNPWSNE